LPRERAAGARRDAAVRGFASRRVRAVRARESLLAGRRAAFPRAVAGFLAGFFLAMSVPFGFLDSRR
jgi:hypothetical protein